MFNRETDKIVELDKGAMADKTISKKLGDSCCSWGEDDHEKCVGSGGNIML